MNNPSRDGDLEAIGKSTLASIVLRLVILMPGIGCRAGFAPLATIFVTDAGSAGFPSLVFDPRAATQCLTDPSANVWCAFHVSAPDGDYAR